MNKYGYGNEKVTRCIFVGGYYRSGTSLLRGILGSHSQVGFIPFDLTLWTWLFDEWGDHDFSSEASRVELARAIANHSKYLKSEVRVREDSLVQAFIASGCHTYAKLVGVFLDEHRRLIGKEVIGHKCPNSERHFETIIEAIPSAKFIQLVRDPRDVAESYANKESFGTLELGALFDRWRESVAIGTRETNRNPGQFLMVKYEDLVGSPVKVVTRICGFLGCEYEPEMLKMERHPGWSGGNSSFSAPRKPQSTIRKSGNWETRMKETEIALFQRGLKGELEALDYPLKRVSLRAGVFAMMRTNQLRISRSIERSRPLFGWAKGAIGYPVVRSMVRIIRKSFQVRKNA